MRWNVIEEGAHSVRLTYEDDLETSFTVHSPESPTPGVFVAREKVEVGRFELDGKLTLVSAETLADEATHLLEQKRLKGELNSYFSSKA